MAKLSMASEIAFVQINTDLLLQPVQLARTVAGLGSLRESYSSAES